MAGSETKYYALKAAIQNDPHFWCRQKQLNVQLIFIEKRNFKTAFIIGIFFSRVNHLQS
jgi:hypothetical protein